jgi:hypothetical protein
MNFYFQVKCKNGQLTEITIVVNTEPLNNALSQLQQEAVKMLQTKMGSNMESYKLLSSSKS